MKTNIEDHQIDGPSMAYFILNGHTYIYDCFAISGLECSEEKAIKIMMSTIENQWKAQKFLKLEGEGALSSDDEFESLVVWRMRPQFINGVMVCRCVFISPHYAHDVREVLSQKYKFIHSCEVVSNED